MKNPVLLDREDLNHLLHLALSESKESDELLTVDEAAEFLKVSKRTVNRLIADEALTSYRVADTNSRRIKKNDILKCLKKR